jgi:hypothetical protein
MRTGIIYPDATNERIVATKSDYRGNALQKAVLHF